jgi:rhodanese-related sulfurtransferase
MNRRWLLAAVGTLSLSVSAGCLNADGDDSGDADGTTKTQYETQSFDGETVPLAPVEDVYEWFEDGDTKFVDTRGVSQYDAGHIPGAVLSPSERRTEHDPTDEWAHDTRVVTYCNCPHTLAVWRASELKAEGFEDVYAIEPGFEGWEEAGHPTASNDPDADVETYEIAGESDPAYEGQYVRVSMADRDGYEIAVIESDGSYKTKIRFPDLTSDSRLIVEAPEYTVEGTLEEFTNETVTEESGEPSQ